MFWKLIKDNESRSSSIYIRRKLHNCVLNPVNSLSEFFFFFQMILSRKVNGMGQDLNCWFVWMDQKLSLQNCLSEKGMTRVQKLSQNSRDSEPKFFHFLVDLATFIGCRHKSSQSPDDLCHQNRQSTEEYESDFVIICQLFSPHIWDSR